MNDFPVTDLLAPALKGLCFFCLRELDIGDKKLDPLKLSCCEKCYSQFDDDEELE